MESPAQKPPLAWDPITPRGVAAFAQATLRRILLVHLAFAVGSAVVVVWFLATGFFPPIRQSIQKLPENSAIVRGGLSWPAENPTRLAYNRFLGFAVDLKHEGKARSPANLHVEFGAREMRVYSLLGYAAWPYPPYTSVAFSRTELEPWWGAWAPAFLAIAALTTIAGLMVVWIVLASIYCPLAWLAGFYGNRHLSLGGSWKFAAMSLMPGALVMNVGVVLYGLCLIDLLRLALFAGLHFVVSWVYPLLAPMVLPRITPGAAKGRNPFARSTALAKSNNGNERAG